MVIYNIIVMGLSIEGFNQYSDELMNYVKELIREKHGNAFFTIWLDADADMSIQHAYESKLLQYYNGQLTPNTKNTMWTATKNIIYAIKSYIKLTPNYTLNSLLEYVDTFMDYQLTEFHNDYDDIEWNIQDDYQPANQPIGGDPD